MKRNNLFIFLAAMLLTLPVALSAATMQQLTAKQVLDKCAKTITSADGVQADFTMTSAQYADVSGTISVKGKKFNASTGVAKMWFDGKTLWTYMTNNDEVNVSTPTDSQLQTLNPYNFINLYRQGYAMTMSSTAKAYTVHLTANDQRAKIRELFVTVDNQTFAPKEVKMLQGSKWTTFAVSNVRQVKLNDALFRFNASEYPDAEVIDLR